MKAFLREFQAKVSQAAERASVKRSWFSRLPKEAQDRLLEIKQAYIAGAYTGVSLSILHMAVASLCKENAWEVPKSRDTVAAWLRSRDTWTLPETRPPQGSAKS
jgi:hypothetical protein